MKVAEVLLDEGPVPPVATVPMTMFSRCARSKAARAAFSTVDSSSGSPFCKTVSAFGTTSRMASRAASNRDDIDLPSRYSVAPSAARSVALAFAMPADAPRMNAVLPSRTPIPLTLPATATAILIFQKCRFSHIGNAR